MNKDIGFACTAFVFAVGYYMMADAIPTSLLADGVGPGGLPKAYAVVLGILSLVLIARSLMRRAAARSNGHIRGESDDDNRVHVPREQLIRVAGMLAIGAIYVVLVQWLGYILTLAVLIAATAYYQGATLTRQLGVVALGGALFFWLLFDVLLRIPQPAGFWPDLF
jgi:hypothetical protein